MDEISQQAHKKPEQVDNYKWYSTQPQRVHLWIKIFKKCVLLEN